MSRIPVSLLMAVVLQVAIVAMLHLNAFLPAFHDPVSQKTGSSMCLGNHTLCGCSPERVAAETCCCYLAERGESSCCDSGQHDEDENDSLPGLYAAPCGGGVSFLEPLRINSDLLLPAAAHVAADAWREHVYSPFLETLEGLTPEPPEPPPRISS